MHVCRKEASLIVAGNRCSFAGGTHLGPLAVVFEFASERNAREAVEDFADTLGRLGEHGPEGGEGVNRRGIGQGGAGKSIGETARKRAVERAERNTANALDWYAGGEVAVLGQVLQAVLQQRRHYVVVAGQLAVPAAGSSHRGGAWRETAKKTKKRRRRGRRRRIRRKQESRMRLRSGD